MTRYPSKDEEIRIDKLLKEEKVSIFKLHPCKACKRLIPNSYEYCNRECSRKRIRQLNELREVAEIVEDEGDRNA